MRIIRERHPLEGRALRVLGRMHREGELHLILSLPDGGTSLIPATWTDLDGIAARSRSARILGRVADLMRMRRLVDVLLRRQDMTGSGPAERENSHATGTVSSGSAGRGATGRAGSPEPEGTEDPGPSSGAAVGQDDPSTQERSER